MLDAYALVAFLGDEPAADEVEALLRDRECVVGVVNLAEAIDVSCRVAGVADTEVRDVLEPMILGGRLAVRTPQSADAWRAAELRCGYYDRKEREISLADCFLLAATTSADEIATADPAVAEVARAEGLQILPLPDSRGLRP